jgi:hypothetical protein
MPLTFAKPPAGSDEALQEGLRAVEAARKAGAEGGQRLAARAPASVMRPHPVYELGLNELAAGEGLGAARLVAWRYLLVANDQITEAAELYPAPRGRTQFGAVTTGFAAGAGPALTLLEQLPEAGQGDYEVRALRVPALYLMAFWLKGKQGGEDRLIVLPPAFPPVQALRPYSPKELLGLLRPLAEEKLRLEWDQTPDYYRPPQAPAASGPPKDGRDGGKKKKK